MIDSRTGDVTKVAPSRQAITCGVTCGDCMPASDGHSSTTYCQPAGNVISTSAALAVPPGASGVGATAGVGMVVGVGGVAGPLPTKR